MITVLAGENGFGLKLALDELVRVFTIEHGEIAVERLEGDHASLERIQESLQSSPFLAAKKLVVLRSPSLNKQFVEAAESLLRGLPETTDVVIVEPKLDKRLAYYKLLKQQPAFHEYAELDEIGLARWLTAAAKEQGGDLTQADARLLVERVGVSQQLLASELEKLLTYDSRITKATIELLVEPTPQGKIFDLLEAAFAGKPRQAMELYLDQRAQKVDPSQIIALLTWQLRIVTIVKAAGSRKASDIVRQAKLSPYTVQKSETIAGRLTLARLKQLIDELLTIDVRSKRERLDLDEALQNYLLKLSQ